MQPGAGLADVPGDRAHGDQAARVVGARRVLGDAHAPEDDPGARLAPQPRDLADRRRVDTADLRGALGRVLLDELGQLAEVGDAVADERAVDEPARDHLVQHAVVEGDVGARLDLAEDVRVVGDPFAPGVDHDQLRAAAAGLLEERGGHGVVGRRVRPREDRHVGVDDVAVGRRHGARADALEQRGHAGGVAQAGAVVDVVGAEAGPDQLLEEVGLLVGALRRSEAGDRAGTVAVVDRLEPGGGEIECLVPGRLAEVRHDLVVVDDAPGALAPAALALDVGRERGLRIRDPDQRRGQALFGGGVVPAIAALDAQPALIAGLVAALGERDRAALLVDVVGQRAAHPAVRADGVDRLELLARADRDVMDRLVDQRTGRARGDALAARHARRLAHRVVQVERDARRVALPGAADDVVALDVVARADAAVAEDAGVVVDADHRVRVVQPAPARLRQPLGVAGVVAAREVEQEVVPGGRLFGVLVGLVGHQQLGQHRALPLDLGAAGGDLHAVLARAHARGREHPAADVDGAHAADADRVVAFVVAQDRDLDAGLLGRREDRRAVRDRHFDAVDRAGDGRGIRLGRDGQGHGSSAGLRS